MTKTISVNQAEFAVTDEGAGEAICFLHGFPLNRSMWQAQVDAFATSHRVIVPDLRGHGQSTVTQGTVTMRQMADDVVALLDALQITQPITLCGLSMGGYVAWELWRSHPDRLARLILCDTRAVADTEEVSRGRHMMAAQVVVNGSSMAADSMPSKLFAPDAESTQPEKLERVRQMILATDPEGIAATQRGMADRIDMTPQLPEITTKSLVICGTHDVISSPEEMRSFANAMPNATFVEIPKAGHLAPLECPDPTNAAIRQFLATS